MNIWQGQFPTLNTAEDGYIKTAPVDAFGPQNELWLCTFGLRPRMEATKSASEQTSTAEIFLTSFAALLFFAAAHHLPRHAPGLAGH